MSALERAWLARDAAQINEHIGRLDKLMPTLAPAGVYPNEARRLAEVTYRRMNLMWWAWLAYILTFFVSIFAVATRYRWVRNVGLVLLVTAIGVHTYDLGLRWYVIGRIPVANMYEAVVSSTLAGTALGLLLELFLRKRVYLLSAGLLGFFALALPELLPDKVDNRLTTMMPILDDIMLRIHTVLIISSYAVITLAYAVANCYLFVSAIRHRRPLAQGTIGAQLGAIGCLALAKAGYFDHVSASKFVMAFTAAVAGGAMVAVGAAAMMLSRRQVSLAGASGGGMGGVAGAVALGGPMGGAALGEPAGGGAIATTVDDMSLAARTRSILDEFDLSHRVLLYTATVSLFVGLVLGAVWADYSWGRPWGWDPKEVFALNTWLVYAILIHARFVTKHKALWTAVLSVVGFAVMQFNWWVVNFYIVGLHSYA
jgi:ABC-type transport system involved in cytochrome c biogenesis permease subunit